MFEPLLERNTKPYAIACWALSAAAASLLAVAAKAAAAEAGPKAPEGWLQVCVEAAVLAAMVFASWRLQAGALDPDPERGTVLAWLGGIYLALALGRIAIGLAVPAAAPWFRAWTPAAFHVALAGYLLTHSFYHRREPPPFW